VKPVETLRAARRLGAELRVGTDGKLHIRGGAALPDDIKSALAEHHQRLVDIISFERPQTAVEPRVERLYWQAHDHVCSTGCTREHVVCNGCGQPLRPHEQHWPFLHLNCRLELVD
jgi:hypothetical protein